VALYFCCVSFSACVLHFVTFIWSSFPLWIFIFCLCLVLGFPLCFFVFYLWVVFHSLCLQFVVYLYHSHSLPICITIFTFALHSNVLLCNHSTSTFFLFFSCLCVVFPSSCLVALLYSPFNCDKIIACSITIFVSTLCSMVF